MTLTPAQKKLQELSERYTQYLIEVSEQVEKMINSDKVQQTDDGVIVPLDLWDNLVKSIRTYNQQDQSLASQYIE